jgi:hypothetical protein
MAVSCNEKGVKKCVEIDFFGAVWYNSVKVAICIMREGVNNGFE